jgi:uncharacterized protein (DUF427 family)
MEPRTPKVPGPEHPITVAASGARVVVRAQGRMVAESTEALTLTEAGYPPVHYIPIADVDETALRPSATSTYCPYKGQASYFSIAGPEGLIEDAVWTYREPYPAMAAIAGHLAFYPDKVEITVTASATRPSPVREGDGPSPP